MAKGSVPTTFAEGMSNVVSALSMTMMAPDAGPKMKLLQQMLQAAVGATMPQGQGGGQPGGGGTNLGQLQGAGGQPPSAGPGGPPSGASQTGASADDIRRMMMQQQGSPS
jgi:hypothetical protein